MSLAFFAVCGLDVLNSLDILSEERREEICDWIYRYQVISDPKSPKQCSGFQGSSTINIFGEEANASGDDNVDAHLCGSEKYKYGHLAMTYTGIAILLTLGDDLSRLNRRAIVDGVAAVQQPDGSFSATVEGNEHDMRFVFCASAICYMLDDWGKVNKQLMADYIKKSIVSSHILRGSNNILFTSFFSYCAASVSNLLQSVLIFAEIRLRYKSTFGNGISWWNDILCSCRA